MPIRVNSKADSEKELSVFKGQATRLINETEKLEIQDNDQLEKATDLLARVKQNIRDVTKKKKAITDPMNQALKETRALFKPIEDKLGNAKDMIGDAVLEYRDVQRRQQEAAAANTEKQLAAGEIDEDQAIDALSNVETQEKTLHGSKGSVTVSTYRDVEIITHADIPDKYWVLDMAAIRRDALGNKAQGIDPIEIPGVQVVEKERI